MWSKKCSVQYKQIVIQSRGQFQQSSRAFTGMNLRLKTEGTFPYAQDQRLDVIDTFPALFLYSPKTTMLFVFFAFTVQFNVGCFPAFSKTSVQIVRHHF